MDLHDDIADMLPRPFFSNLPRFERGSCGVGFVARIDGWPSHAVIEDGITVLSNLEHRGPEGFGMFEGRCAGILTEIPDDLFQSSCQSAGFSLPERGDYAVAMVFLPVDTSFADRCCERLESICTERGARVLGWRDVPADENCLNLSSRRTMPHIKQLFVFRGDIAADEFERSLYIMRRIAEKDIGKLTGSHPGAFYISSFSSHMVVYKGMINGRSLPCFYRDLADPAYTSSFSIVHLGYTTNINPAWHLAQPLRFVAHNGTINTISGNRAHMSVREPTLASPYFGDDIAHLTPVIAQDGNDSSAFDNVLELLVHSGRSLPHTIMMMIPEAWGDKYLMSEDRKAFYEYHSAIMEPWDGPAVMVFTDGRYVGARLDRNGLRSARYTITHEGIVTLASEAGALMVPGDQVRAHGRLHPGRMFLVDLQQNRVVPDHIIKAKICRQKPYRHWINNNRIELRGLLAPSRIPPEDPDVLIRKQQAFGYSDEELRLVGIPMTWGQEAVGAMGDDTPLALMSRRPKLLFQYFKQLFAQVVSPPIDPLREELVMSLMNFAGIKRNILDETPEHFRRVKLPHPILTPQDMERIRTARHPDIVVGELDMLYPADGDGAALEKALSDMFARAVSHIRDGVTFLILTDRGMDAGHAPMPVLLALSGLNNHLVEQSLRHKVGIVVETGEAREAVHFAMLIGYGANAVSPHVAFSTIRSLVDSGRQERAISADEAIDLFITAVKKGILKTLSRVGISTVRSYYGAHMYEIVGLSPDVVDRYFTGTVSRIGGIGLDEIARETCERHRLAYPKDDGHPRPLAIGGEYHEMENGEPHLWSKKAVELLHRAVREDDYGLYREFTKCVHDDLAEPFALRSLFRFKSSGNVPVGEVEPEEFILRHFSSAGMSFGALNRMAHEAIAIAMNRLGSASNTGEGGEDPARFEPGPDGVDRNSAIKQVASGRFGVTTDYLVHAKEVQIKITQGAKPGEGGQLPGLKVDAEIALVRRTTPGVTLISPPPHHDVYSIEDLAQLIHDIKSVNPRALISVKIASEMGVGAVASGIAKTAADIVLISGYDGGTGSSPLASIKYTGVPWELGLAEARHILARNGLRDRIRIRVDGQLKSGRDLAIASLLGADEFSFGTIVLLALGCVMQRECHLNTCTAGIATNDPELCDRFGGGPEHIERLFRFLARDLREHMAMLGFRTLDAMRGHVELLDIAGSADTWKARGVDVSAIIAPTGRALTIGPVHTPKITDPFPSAFEQTIIELAAPAVEGKEAVHLAMPVRNVNRSVGSGLSGEIVRRHGEDGLPPDTVKLYLKGSAGLSLGAFLAPGVTIRVEGNANDYLGKGMSGGRIILTPPDNAGFSPPENVIAGNTALYGATGGELFCYGLAGERFAVRNSGARAVVEGLGDHGCEYMTGGIVVVLGQTGNNFAAGMSGGIAYVFDESETFEARLNLDMVDLESVYQDADIRELKDLVELYYKATESVTAERILDTWEANLPLFVKVMPVDYRISLERMRLSEAADRETLSATEEVYKE